MQYLFHLQYPKTEGELRETYLFSTFVRPEGSVRMLFAQ